MGGDDLARINFVSDLYLKAVGEGNFYDIVMAGHTERNEIQGTEKNYRLPAKLTTGRSSQQIASLKIIGKIKTHMCSSIYKRSFLEKYDLKFSVGCTAGEDVEFAVKSMVRSSSTGFLEKNDYIYIVHGKKGIIENYESRTKKIRRYSDNTMAHIRTTEYISRFAEDRDLIFLNNYMLLPQTVQREINLLAIKDDHIAFLDKIKDKKTRKILWDSIQTIKIKPEVFIKTLFVLLSPNLYYRYYSKRY